MTTQVELQTNHGDIRIELDAAKAPESTRNFLAYVDSGHYEGTVFHRVIKGFMIQGGGFAVGMKQKPTQAELRNEANNGLKNDHYTLAMARTSAPHSATSQFFINTTDNAFPQLQVGEPAGLGLRGVRPGHCRHRGGRRHRKGQDRAKRRARRRAGGRRGHSQGHAAELNSVTPSPASLPVFGEMPAAPDWSVVDFISDLHLSEDMPRTFDAWAQWMGSTSADAVFILGDLFETWVGDDARHSGFEADCTQVLAAAASQRSVAVMVGNRDFLIGREFLAACGACLLTDPTVLAIAGEHLAALTWRRALHRRCRIPALPSPGPK